MHYYLLFGDLLVISECYAEFMALGSFFLAGMVYDLFGYV